MTRFFRSGKDHSSLACRSTWEVLRIVRAGIEMAEKNGNDSLAFQFPRGLASDVVFDFDGADGFVTRSYKQAEYPTGQRTR